MLLFSTKEAVLSHWGWDGTSVYQTVPLLHRPASMQVCTEPICARIALFKLSLNAFIVHGLAKSFSVGLGSLMVTDRITTGERVKE